MTDVRPSLQTRPLADEVFMVSVDDDIIVLDARSDSYGCFADLSDQVCISDNRVRALHPLINDMETAGLLSSHQASERTAIPALPSSFLGGTSGDPHLIDTVHILRAVLRAKQTGHGATVATLISALPPRPARSPRVTRIAAVTGRYQTMLPWIPDQGACLYRSFVLLSALRHAGQDAVWVFGVRTWPFSAHCWLQFGDRVLDDDPERVCLYTPIMAV